MSAKKQPNIIVMVSHDTGRHISPYGIKTVRTPNAERLAAEGVMFTNSFCTSPGCCPSRAGLFRRRVR
ncbi:MAG: sulfatase-like hydrolase/transferase [Lentisphaerae bacterium]|nr:sulfatase-like hydrolase/transferase [Lentisphaerota bacterium]